MFHPEEAFRAADIAILEEPVSHAREVNPDAAEFVSARVPGIR